MSKKETEFDRVSRLKKMQRELAVEKRKSLLMETGAGPKKGKLKTGHFSKKFYSNGFDVEYMLSELEN
ncbi:MAG: hypothetical protein LBV08_04405 [Clostridiales bacterium]|nr:hypothetical protein [Clostridiales bacterium]